MYYSDIIVKGRSGGLNGALGSCFGHFRSTFSAFSHCLRFATRMMKTTHGGLGTNIAEAF